MQALTPETGTTYCVHKVRIGPGGASWAGAEITVSECDVVVITGAGGDIGRAIAMRLAGAGAAIAAVDAHLRNAEETLRQLEATGGRGLALQADVTVAADLAAALEDAERVLGPVRVWVNNAGREGEVAPVSEYSEPVFDEVMAVNAKGVFLGMKHVLPRMLRGGRGAVINIASTSAIRGRAGLAAYVASKHAVLGLTRVAALEVADTGVRVNAVLPGPVEGRMIWELESRAATVQGQIRRAGAARRARPVDVANTVAFLASDEAAHVNGATLVVDGGATIP